MKKAFVFPGQGSQAVGMGKEVYDNFAIARDIFGEVNEELSFDLAKLIFEGPIEELTLTYNAQPALMCVSIAILRVMESEEGRSITDMCDFIAGHSLGEYTALCAGGAIDLATTARLLKIRGDAMVAASPKGEGSMAAILGVDIEVAQEIAAKSAQGDVCQVANDNSVGQVVLSGHTKAIDRAVEIAREMGAKRALKLPVGGAFHSQLIADAAVVMREALANAEVKMPVVPLIANVSANIVGSVEEIKSNLVAQVTGSVRWRETMLYLESQGVEEIVEIGSGKVLSALVGRTCKAMQSRSIQAV